ncbi:MAG TPA: hypothetical protein VL443_22370 [Cyclobacteriaceae bacterium]|jgi:hypothetical protein|nr:hypothetical protein [Cyclobacteriaceae bacterium]
MQNHFETDYVTTAYDKANHVVILKWKVAPTSVEFREGLDSIISAMEHFKTGKLIADTTHLGAIHPDDQEWSTTVWAQKAVSAGYSKLALVIPSDIFTKMSVEDTMNMDKTETPSAYFDTIDAAIDWIK